MNPLDELRSDVKLCRRCPLTHERTCAVPGEGPRDAQIVIVGEAPGDYEDRLGEPFVGKPGDKLDEWLEKAGLTRDEVFLTTLLKCKPSEGRFPDYKPDGPVDRCLPYLHTQLRTINPLAVIVAGKHPLQHLVLAGSPQRVAFLDEWVGKILRRRDLFGDVRIGVVFPPAQVARSRNPVDNEKCVRTIRAIANYCGAKRRGEPAPIMDMADVRPIAAPAYQQRFRLFPSAAPEEAQ